jgi:hypothetical protein
MEETEKKAASRHRRTYLVNRVFQVRFILEIVAVVLASTLLAAAAFYFLADWELSSTFFSVHREVQDIRLVLLPAVALTALVVFGLVAGLCIYITLRETNRLAGPLYRFEQNVRLMAEGRFDLVTRLRHGDELQRLAEALDAMGDGVGGAAGRMREAASVLRLQVEGLEARRLLPDAEAEKLRAGMAEMEKAIGFFRR